MADNGCSPAELKARIVALEVGRDADHRFFEERDQRYERRALDQDKAVAAALAASEKALTKADQALEKRLDSLNELRQMVQDQGKDFARSDLTNTWFKAQEDRIQGLADLVRETAATKQGGDRVWAYIVGLGGLLIAGLSLFFHH